MRKFAWWPQRMTSGKRVWLACYWRYQSAYDASTGRPSLFNQYFEYCETDQERTWRLLKESAVQNRNIWNQPELTNEDRKTLPTSKFF